MEKHQGKMYVMFKTAKEWKIYFTPSNIDKHWDDRDQLYSMRNYLQWIQQEGGIEATWISVN